MPIRNRIADLHDEVTGWRRDMHQNPELMFETHRTSAFIADKLREFGCDEVVTGIGRTGVVGVIKGKTDSAGKVVGLRADMDALPIKEATGLEYASRTEGVMHACGHDGHSAMLLGAAKYLAETRNFDGALVVIFQPAEEGGGGAREMCEDDMMARWNIQEVYGMHTGRQLLYSPGAIFRSHRPVRYQRRGLWRSCGQATADRGPDGCGQPRGAVFAKRGQSKRGSSTANGDFGYCIRDRVKSL